MSMTNSEITDKVAKRAGSLDIPLLNFVEKPIDFYTDGGVTGFSFQPKNYDLFKQTVKRSVDLLKMGNDFEAGTIGAIMGLMARKEGYVISAREYSDGSSLHLELSKLKCDAHIDSHGITPGQNVPLWANQYDPTRLFSHGLNDLLPSMLADSKLKAINPILQRLSIDLRLNGHDFMLDGKYSKQSPIKQFKTKNQIMFSLIIEM